MSRYFVLRVRDTRWSLRVERRSAAIGCGLLVALVAAMVVGLTLGELRISMGEVVHAVFGHASSATELAVMSLRMPRVVGAVLVGAALGCSGTLFQQYARNPLVAPDVIGINSGASLAGATMVVTGASTSLIGPAALCGAVGAALLVGGLSWKHGLSGYRLVLVGIGVNAVLGAGISFVLTRANVYEVERAYRWLVGSLYGLSWPDVVALAVVMAVAFPIAIACGPRLAALQLGEDVAGSLGIRVNATGIVVVGTGCALAAFAVALAGPIGFVAFIAPHLARRLTLSTGTAVLPVASLVGALLVLVSDIIAQRVFAPTALPVGVVTAILGAPYFMFLLVKNNRLGRAS